MTEWLSIPQAAKRLGVGTPLVYRSINTGQLAAWRFGRVFRTTTEAVDAFLETARVQPGDLNHLMPPVYDGPRHIDLRAVEAS